jgi:hypothetical protein
MDRPFLETQKERYTDLIKGIFCDHNEISSKITDPIVLQMKLIDCIEH